MSTTASDWRGRTCLVLGGGGFIGTWLVDELVRRGADVRGYGRMSQIGKQRCDVTWFTNDFTDRVALARAVEGVEIVFHLLGGGTPESSNADPYGDMLAGPGTTLRLMDMCRSEGVKRLIFASSGGTVYGIPDAIPIPESARTNPISAYGVGKLMVEKYLHLYGHLHKFDYRVLRISNPFGPYQNPFRRQGLVAAVIYKMLSDLPVEVWGDGGVVRDFLFVGDLTEAFLRAADHQGSERIFNIGSGEGLSVLEVVQGIAMAIGSKEPRIVHKPGRTVDVPANVLNIDLARLALGWHPRTSWTEGVKVTTDWVRHLVGGKKPKN